MRDRAIIAAVIALLVAAGCAGRKPASQQPPMVSADAFVESGFLTVDYSQLTQVEPGEARRIYRNPDAQFDDYEKIFIDRITIWRDDDQREPVDSADFQKVVDAIHAVASKEFGRTFGLADKPGTGVARMRLALVAIDDPDDHLDVYISHGDPSPMQSEEPLPAGLREFGRKAWMEAEMLDAVTNEPIFAVVDRLADVIPRNEPIATWRDLHRALEAWAEQGAKRLSAVKSES